MLSRDSAEKMQESHGQREWNQIVVCCNKG